MSTFGWFALIILPVLGGLIAWAGDVIGYRLGKARRSLFGLRPRTTARVIGVTVGVLLPLIGVGTALLGSRDVKDALFHLDELRQERIDLEGKNRQLGTQIGALEQRIKQTELKANSSEREAILYRGYRDTALVDLQQARGHLRETQQRLAGAQAELGRAHRLVAQARARADVLHASIKSIEVSLASAEESLASAEAGLRLTESRRKAEEERVVEAHQMMEAAAIIMQSPVVLESGHILVRVILPVGETLQETEGALGKVLALASEAARAQGAEAVGGGLAIKLIRPAPPGRDLKAFELPRESDVLRAVAEQLQAAGKRQFVVDVTVARRMYRDEIAPVGVEMKAWPYVRVLLENELIYSVTIDGSAKRSDVFNQLYNLVSKIVRREAQEKGLLPDPKTGEYGKFPTEQLLEALDEVLAHKGPVLVRVLAAADTFIADPLSIKIEVGKGAAGEPVGSGD